MRGRSRLAFAAVAGVATAAAVGAYVVHRGGQDVHGSPTTEYVPALPVQPPAPSLPWPQWGRDLERTRAAPSALRPPYHVRWVFHGRSLLEFPPAIAYGRVYLPTFAGLLVALDADTGRVLWRHRSGRCAWASPAVADGLVLQTFLLRGPRCDPDIDRTGELIAFDARTGAVRWRVALPATESSPLVAHGLVTIGDWNGDVLAFDLRTGARRWAFHADGPVKSSAALAGSRVFIGTYGGSVYALDARTGRRMWRASAQQLWLRHGSFYSTPAVAHGRVYVGSTDGKVYAFGVRSGRLRWSRSTRGYVYGSPATWRDFVLVGSYDHRLYALDAATGAVRWSFDADGPISGAVSVIGGIAYVSTLSETTFALDASNGRLLWRFPDGKYSAAVADATQLYLVGAGRLFALVPHG